MIISDEMKQSVDKQPQELIPERDAVGLGLRYCPGYADDDITKSVARQGHALFSHPISGLIGQGKREDVSRLVEAAVPEVKFPHGRVADKDDTQLRLLQSEQSERPA